RRAWWVGLVRGGARWVRPGAAAGVCRLAWRAPARATARSLSPSGWHAMSSGPVLQPGSGTDRTGACVEGGSLGGWAGVTGADALALAGELLPAVSGQLPCCGDIHAALVEALVQLRADSDRYHRLRLADEARDMLAAFLVATGQARQQPRVSATVRGWAIRRDPAGLRRGLAEAARYWRAQPAPYTSDMDSGV